MGGVGTLIGGACAAGVSGGGGVFAEAQQVTLSKLYELCGGEALALSSTYSGKDLADPPESLAALTDATTG